MRRFGWTLEDQVSKFAKCVIIGAPHTSNWDFPLALIAMSAMGRKFNWVGKHTLFIGPLKWLSKTLGGIPVDRRVHTGFIQKMVETFGAKTRLNLCITPEGTRSRTKYWHSGFYYIALEAEVPIIMAYIDYGTRTLGLGESLVPSGDIEADMKKIQSFYQGMTGKHPEKQGAIRLRPRE